MKTLRTFFMAGIVLFLASCASYNYNMTRVQQLDFSQYKTYGWLPPVDSLSKNYFNNDIARENILSAANRELAARGMQYSKNDPDILFRYVTIVNNKSRMVYGHMGGWGGWGWYRPWGYYMSPSYPIGKEKYRYSHLIIEAVDRRTNSVVWQARGSGEIKAPEKAINKLPEVVQGIFKEYPIK
ncbi:MULTISPECIES: DUF4136 domain-containing protein [Sphingobacterium]|uniref:DUF4136 domain-containing protein n=1 Tax=Sphingobacterium tenebrionis TaxID=3111775 RepID=A0ABU8I5B3_9SPHI|nr:MULTISPECIES: DUF4136 domain-containing protein [unclassified Sphingobacterium]QBR12361.1 DUF4136 domain-containing protein [Sphingobacterium sp. CZ-2]